MEELINDIPYGVIVCHKDGNIVYKNSAATEILNSETEVLGGTNILSYIDDGYVNAIKEILTNPNEDNTIHLHLKTKTKTYKVVPKRSQIDTNNIILMVYDSTKTAETIKENTILKTISDICKDVFYKDRSTLDEIVLALSQAFHLKLAAIYFRNGCNHLVYCKKTQDDQFECKTLEGTQTLSDQDIWMREQNYVNCKDLIFTVKLKDTDGLILRDLKERMPDQSMNILKLKLTDENVIGFLEFIEDDNLKLSNSELEILESLSQILAYIINNKEQVADLSAYIKQQFDNIAQR